MKTYLIITIILGCISLLFNLMQKVKISDLVEENKELRGDLDFAKIDSINSISNLNTRLLQELKKSEDFERKFLYTLAILININKNWKKKLTFYNPEACTPTVMLKYQESTQTYQVYKIAGKAPLEIDSDFRFADKRLEKITEALRTDINGKVLIENQGIVPSLSEVVKLLNAQ